MTYFNCSHVFSDQREVFALRPNSVGMAKRSTVIFFIHHIKQDPQGYWKKCELFEANLNVSHLFHLLFSWGQISLILHCTVAIITNKLETVCTFILHAIVPIHLVVVKPHKINHGIWALCFCLRWSCYGNASTFQHAGHGQRNTVKSGPAATS